MPTITVPDETYERLAKHASLLGTTPDAVALPAIERAAVIYERSHTPTPADPPPLAGDEWVRKFEAFNRSVQAEAARCPSGFRLDDSREAMYEGRGE